MIGFFDTDLGRVQISPSIVRRLIINEVESSRFFRFPGVETGETVGRKSAEKLIRVIFSEGSVETTLVITVRYGARIIKEARELQGKIARALELSAGLVVDAITINVENVFEDTAEQPLLIEHESLRVDAVNQ